MSNVAKTTLKGHGLQDEGRQYYNSRGVFTSMWPDDLPAQYGRCECGQTFGPGWPQTKIKQAHREHKAELR